MIRAVWVGINLLLATFVCASTAVIYGTFRPSPEFYNFIARSWARWILWASAVRVRMLGLENLALDEPQIIVANHVSWFDVFALAACLPKRFRFVAKIELASIPIFGRAWLAAGHIAVNRQDHQAAIASLDAAAAAVREDHSAIVIFPEGTRSADGALLPFKKGAFMMALRTGVPLLPAAVIGSARIMPKNGWRVQSGEITIRFGEAVDPAGYSEAARDQLIHRVRSEIAAMIAAPALPTE